MKRSLPDSLVETWLAGGQAAEAPAVFDGQRQPVHTVYGGAHLFKPDTGPRLGELARAALAAHGGDPQTFASALGISGDAALAQAVFERVRQKLAAEPVEDFRIDFEDGYGNRADSEEDHHVERAAAAVAEAAQRGSLPPFIGIRIKPLTGRHARRALRTLDGFVTALAKATEGALPAGFAITLPKVTSAAEVAFAANACDELERALGLPAGVLALEIMVETTEAIFDASGATPLPRFVEAARGRCRGAHFGTYDYTADCDIVANHQHMAHPACDFARHVMKVSLAGRGVWLSDGATNILPVGDTEQVRQAWRLHAGHVRNSLTNGIYQGWDLHPAQLPSRYGAVYTFFHEALSAATERLRNLVEQAARATLAGEVFDDAATGLGLINFFLRGLACGALTDDDVHPTGLTTAQLRARDLRPAT